MPRGFHLIIGAQFASALADNALLIVAIALLIEQGHPGWWAPLLKFCFTLAYVLLAPGVGVLADALPKGRLMMWMNLLKVVGVIGLLLGAQPLLCFAIVGLGAAAYAPAKYGLITEIVAPEGLVRANAWIEVSVVCAALMGTVIGGFLVTEIWLTWSTPAPLGAAEPHLSGVASMLGLHTNYTTSLLALLAGYGLAAWLNLGIPDSGRRYPPVRLRGAVALWALLSDFRAANGVLWRDREGGLSLAVTTVFWGFGATLQFAVLRWATDHLNLRLDEAAYLQAAVAIGVIAGAAWAGQGIALTSANKVLPLGIALGLLVPAVGALGAWGGLWVAALGLGALGALGGVLVVPMNALLQHRGYVLLTAGRSIAVQGFNENLSVLVMLAVYATLLALDWPVLWIMTIWGLGIAAFMGALTWRWHRSTPASAPAQSG